MGTEAKLYHRIYVKKETIKGIRWLFVACLNYDASFNKFNVLCYPSKMGFVLFLSSIYKNHVLLLRHSNYVSSSILYYYFVTSAEMFVWFVLNTFLDHWKMNESAILD